MLRRLDPPAIHRPASSYCQLTEDTNTGTIYVAGQVGLAPDGTLVGVDMASQLRQVLANFDAILRELGLDRAAFARRSVFVTDMDEYFTDAVNGQMTAYFEPNRCPSTLIGVSRLFMPDVKIEVEAVLVRPRG